MFDGYNSHINLKNISIFTDNVKTSWILMIVHNLSLYDIFALRVHTKNKQKSDETPENFKDQRMILGK